MDEEAPTPDAALVAELDRRLLELLRAGHSTVTAGEMLGLTLARTALRLQALRRRLGVASTAAAIDAVHGAHPPQDPPEKSSADGAPEQRADPSTGSSTGSTTGSAPGSSTSREDNPPGDSPGGG